MNRSTRRPALLVLIALLASTLTPTTAPAAEPKDAGPFRLRGYYITFMRMPTHGLDEWKRAVDGFRDEGVNLLILWTAGGFRSEKFPVTWEYNAEHRNVRADFLRDLIDHAHTRGIKVVVGFTPFAYDGTNQYPLRHPALRATDKDGKPVPLGGIHCWGHNLCPSRPEAQRFMAEYVREMVFDSYPNADGLLIESSDYAICHCPACREHYFEREFEFVRRISDEVWAKKPDATIMVYPHYFSGKDVPGFGGVKGTKHELDRRWTLFFTPHSAHLDADLVARAGSSVYWDDAPALHTPNEIRAGARRAREASVDGYVPSLEAFSFVARHPEEGQQWLVGRRQVPFGFGWLPADRLPYGELLGRVNRTAYRAFTRDPELSTEAFKNTLARDLLGEGATPQDADDLLYLHQVFFSDRSWCQPAPLVCPDVFKARRAGAGAGPELLAEYRSALERIRGVERRHRDADGSARRELARSARWVLDQWQGDNAALLSPAGR